MSKGLRHAHEKLREIAKARQGGEFSRLHRLIARISEHLEESQTLYHDARHMARDLTGDEDF